MKSRNYERLLAGCIPVRSHSDHLSGAILILTLAKFAAADLDRAAGCRRAHVLEASKKGEAFRKLGTCPPKTLGFGQVKSLFAGIPVASFFFEMPKGGRVLWKDQGPIRRLETRAVQINPSRGQMLLAVVSFLASQCGSRLGTMPC